MSTPPDALRLAEELRPSIERFPGIAAAWLFGSAARGELRPDSDVDIALLLRDPLITALDCYADLAALTARLESVTHPHPVDVVLIEPQGPIFAHEVLIDGVRILDVDPERRIAFEARTIVRAIDFRPTWELARAGQMEGIRRRLRTLR